MPILRPHQTEHSYHEDDNPNLIFTNSSEYSGIFTSWLNHCEEIMPAIERPVLSGGNLSRDLAVGLLKSLDSLPVRKFRRNDCVETYVASSISPEEVYNHRLVFSLFNFEKEQLALVKLICEEIKPFLESCLGIGFRVINVKATESIINPPIMHGPNMSHLDALPEKIHKVLVYLTEAGEFTGTTAFSKVDVKDYLRGPKAKKPIEMGDSSAMVGPPGSFMFFNPNAILHRGFPGKGGRKVILEITICPAHETEINPTFNGTNSRHPILIP